MTQSDFTALVGETLTEVHGCEKGSERIEFVTATGRCFVMQHIQDCCESVTVEDVTGDPQALLGSPVTLAREDSNSQENPSECESCTWTFYNLGTAKASATIRWLGESNGYYSESVDFDEATP
jgi:hypothetical protein